MPGGVLQQNTLYSGLLITDKQDRVNEKIMLEFLKKRGGTCMNSNIITKVQIQTQNINKLWFIILCGMPYRRNSKTWRWSIRQQEPLPCTPVGPSSSQTLSRQCACVKAMAGNSMPSTGCREGTGMAARNASPWVLHCPFSVCNTFNVFYTSLLTVSLIRSWYH